jgi:hypothetical protein
MEANIPVKNTVAPIPMYFWWSVGVRFSILTLAPEQNQKKFFSDSDITFLVGDGNLNAISVITSQKVCC